MSQPSAFEVYSAAQKAFHYGLHDVADKIAQVIEKNVWRRYALPNGEAVEHLSFAAFVIAPPPRGLGTDVDTVQRVCRDTPYALDLVDQALQRPHGGDRSKIDNINLDLPNGTSATQALRRLRKDRPDLHEQVIAGELSPHAAAVIAGFRRKTISIPIDAQRAARAISRHFPPDELTTLVKELLIATEKEEKWLGKTTDESRNHD